MKDIELYNDHFQNYKVYQIPKAQLVIADIPYNAGLDFYGCELDKEYFDKANERFEKEIHGVEVIGDTIVTQQSLFD